MNLVNETLRELTSRTSQLPLDVAQLRKSLSPAGYIMIEGVCDGLISFEKITKKYFSNFLMPPSRFGKRSFEILETGDGYTSAVHATHNLFGHSEAHYSPGSSPDVCFFTSLSHSPGKGGETFVIDASEFASALPKYLFEQFLEVGVSYRMLWSPVRWRAELGVSSRVEAEALLAEREDLSGRFDASDTLELTYTTSVLNFDNENSQWRFIHGFLPHLPFIDHPRYGDRELAMTPSNEVSWGDGKAFSRSDINAVIDVHDALKAGQPWVVGDLLILDNRRVLHGRNEQESSRPRTLLSRFGFW